MKHKMTKFECARILGIRATQLGMSAPVLADVPDKFVGNSLYTAAVELKQGMLDIVLRRPLPSGGFYEVNVSELSLPDDVEALIRMFESTP